MKRLFVIAALFCTYLLVVSSQSAQEHQQLWQTNFERWKQGLGPLAFNTNLYISASNFTARMTQYQFFDHVDPTTGSTFVERNTWAGYTNYQSAAENIAWGYSTSVAVTEGWMNSPGHRANILTASLTELGVSFNSTGLYWAQSFGNRFPQCGNGYTSSGEQCGELFRALM
eukprot:TRINITY_DN622_c0_g1_i4.p2 TRINITY_DN622_c0_g1~~TRINITY_DN622_c0_g1_i4.p2  ORF type:complete len:171 (+),score=26.95 TRINITY_DN622_c0_g1_i4:669-1181(+)